MYNQHCNLFSFLVVLKSPSCFPFFLLINSLHLRQIFFFECSFSIISRPFCFLETLNKREPLYLLSLQLPISWFLSFQDHTMPDLTLSISISKYGYSSATLKHWQLHLLCKINSHFSLKRRKKSSIRLMLLKILDHEVSICI